MGNFERRTFLRNSVAAVAASAVAAASFPSANAGAIRAADGAVADPLKGVIAAYRAELSDLCRHLDVYGEDVEMEQPILAFLQEGDVPAAATLETALDALRLAAQEHRDGFGDHLVGNLVEAALAFFEGQTA